MELARLLGRVNEVFLGLNDFLSTAIWARQPDPIRACQILGNLIDQCDEITARVAMLRQHATLLWDLSHQEAVRRDRSVD
jgi:hypothetical protein